MALILIALLIMLGPFVIVLPMFAVAARDLAPATQMRRPVRTYRSAVAW